MTDVDANVSPLIALSEMADPRPGHRAALFRIALTYLWRHGRFPDLQHPERLTEHVQRRKLYDRDPRLPILADKVEVKQWVRDRLGPEWVIPTFWSGSALPHDPQWPLPFVVKARHACKRNAFCREQIGDWETLRRLSAKWMKSRYGWWLDEWLYGEIPRGLLVEPFIGASYALPTDYKFLVLNGRVQYIEVHLDREHRPGWLIFDRHWRLLGDDYGILCPKPPMLALMIAAAEELGRDFDFLRVDLYAGSHQPLFGEVTFYPGSGLNRIRPDWLDLRMGALLNDSVHSRTHGGESQLADPPTPAHSMTGL